MTEPRKKNPTFGIAVFIVIVVLAVIATLFYNAIKEKRDFEQQSTPLPAAASTTTTTGPTGGTGASQ
jgi:heme/copper-type cytochrome/quinol oxidase subunit 2